MKRKRTLLMFVALLFAVCVSCAFLAGCADNENKDDGSDVGDNVSDIGSDTDFDYSLVTGDEIFCKGRSLEDIISDIRNSRSLTLEMQAKGIDIDGNPFNTLMIFKVDEHDQYYCYDLYNFHDDYYLNKEYRFLTKEFNYILYDYDDNNEKTKGVSKDLSHYYTSKYNNEIVIEYAVLHIENYLNEKDNQIIVSDIYGQENIYQNDYVNLQGNLIEFGFTYEKEKTDVVIKIYSVNSTEIEIPDVDLSDATWSDRVEYNGITYEKAADSDGNEYYYVSYNPGSAEPEKTINTLPVKASHE